VKVLITGASGQVGSALLASAPPDAELRALTESDLDITDVKAVRAAAEAFPPDLIINAAAYTAVDMAESDRQRAAAVNADGPRNLAEAAGIHGACRLLHISTDYVFNGRTNRPYRPSDPTNPLSVYGCTKLRGEQAVREVLPDRSAVLRTAWVYAARGSNFVLTMLRLMRERGSVRVVADQSGSPTAAASVARALWRLAELRELNGIFHWTDEGVVSWYGFACAIAEEATALGALPALPEVIPIATADYPTAAPRPQCSALDTRDTEEQFGLTAVPWRTNLRAVLLQTVAEDTSDPKELPHRV
jgi:dTDP-4-dehydrorhamnose reductase